MAQPNHPRTYYAQTMPGVEKICWLEIRRRFPGAVLREYLYAREKNGIVLFDYAGAPHDLLDLRSTEDVFLLASSEKDIPRNRSGLRVVAEKIASDSFDQALQLFLKER